MALISSFFAIVGTLAIVLSVLGLFAYDEPADRLHYVGPLTTIAPICIAIAIVCEAGLTSQAGLKSLVVAVAMMLTNPIASYVTLRALATRERGAPVPNEPPIVLS